MYRLGFLDTEPRLKHYRFCRCFSVACPEGELGDVHVSVVLTGGTTGAALGRSWRVLGRPFSGPAACDDGFAMLVLRCTTKVFRKVGSRPQAAEVVHLGPTFGEWYVNTIDFLNRGNLLTAFLHAPSRYVLLVPIKPVMDAEGLVTAFCTHFLGRLIELQTPPESAHRVLSAYLAGAVLAKTTCRKALGHLNAVIREMEFVLDVPEPYVGRDNTLMVPRIEHRLNATPRGGRKDYVWPLEEFWDCLRDCCPELLPRRPIDLLGIEYPEVLEESEKVFRERLPLRLASKLHATLQQMDVLYTVDELRVLEKATRGLSTPGQGLLPGLIEEIHRQARLQRERLLQE